MKKILLLLLISFSVRAVVDGECISNQFADRIEYFSAINWPKATSESVVKFRIYRNGELIAELPRSRTSFEDHNRPLGTKSNYEVRSVDEGNNETSIGMILVSCP